MTVRDPAQADEESRSPFKGKTGLVRVRNAFFYSCSGLASAFRHESAFRQEVLLAAILIPVAFLVPVARVERAALVASVLLILIVELLNACVEAAIDRISHDRHPLSGRAKDMGSAAVFVSLILCAAVWAIILAPLVT
jgi:diacylglycerol kinase (ATP)